MLHSAHTGSHPVPHTHTPTMRTPHQSQDTPGIQFGIAKRMFDVAQLVGIASKELIASLATHTP